MTSSEGQKNLARSLREEGLTFRENVRSLPGTPDIVTDNNRVIFYHGCYWHGHECRITENDSGLKIARRARLRKKDQLVASKLRKLGYQVLTVWECNFQKDPKKEIRRIMSILAFD